MHTVLLNYGLHPKIFSIEGITSNNPFVSDFLSSVQEATKFAHYPIPKQNEKMAMHANKSRIQHKFNIGDKAWLSTKTSHWRMDVAHVN